MGRGEKTRGDVCKGSQGTAISNRKDWRHVAKHITSVRQDTTQPPKGLISSLRVTIVVTGRGV